MSEPPRITDCATDDQAIEEARLLADGWAIELWEGERLVIRVSDTDATAGREK
jgi:hypothetical protein